MFPSISFSCIHFLFFLFRAYRSSTVVVVVAVVAVAVVIVFHLSFWWFLFLFPPRNHPPPQRVCPITRTLTRTLSFTHISSAVLNPFPPNPFAYKDTPPNLTTPPPCQAPCPRSRPPAPWPPSPRAYTRSRRRCGPPCPEVDGCMGKRGKR